MTLSTDVIYGYDFQLMLSSLTRKPFVSFLLLWLRSQKVGASTRFGLMTKSHSRTTCLYASVYLIVRHYIGFKSSSWARISQVFKTVAVASSAPPTATVQPTLIPLRWGLSRPQYWDLTPVLTSRLAAEVHLSRWWAPLPRWSKWSSRATVELLHSNQPTKPTQGCTRLPREATYRFEILDDKTLILVIPRRCPTSSLPCPGSMQGAMQHISPSQPTRPRATPTSPTSSTPSRSPPTPTPTRCLPARATSSSQNVQVSPNLNFRGCSQRLRAASHRADTTLQLRILDLHPLEFLAVGPTASTPTCLLARQVHRRRHQHRVSSTAPTLTLTPASLGGGLWDLSLPSVGLISTSSPLHHT